MLGPIFVREWSTLPRRTSHYVGRTAYLGLLAVLGLTIWQLLIGWGQAAALGAVARFGQLLFQVLAYAQLTFLLFFSALKGVGAVAEEKDRRTFLLLLLTDLRNSEIVLGKLAGALLPTLLLLLGSVPIFAVLLLLGGVGPEQVPQVLLIHAAGCIAVGSFGGLMALWREQTFPALALTFLGVVLYLCGVRALNLVAVVPHVQECLDPYLALRAVLDPPMVNAPPLPAGVGFFLTMLGLSVVLNVIGIVRLRVWNPRGEPAQQRERPEDDEEALKQRGRVTQEKSRTVWSNPILWREIGTRAYGRRSSLIKFGYLLAFVLIAGYAVSLDNPKQREAFAAANGLVPTMVLSLWLIGAQAVTAITRERDLCSLDLLLATDLTPREFIFGKLLGIAFNSWAYLLPPLVLAGYYATRGMLAPLNRGSIDVSQNVQAFICIAGTQLILAAFTMVLGLHVGLRIEDSRTAVVQVLSAIFFLTTGTLLCIGLIVVSGRFEYQWGSFIIFVGAGIGGFWWVLNGEWSSGALILASWACPFAILYAVMNVLIGKPGSEEASSPWVPFVAITVSFGFTIRAMLTPLLSEFDLALGRTHRAG